MKQITNIGNYYFKANESKNTSSIICIIIIGNDYFKCVFLILLIDKIKKYFLKVSFSASRNQDKNFFLITKLIFPFRAKKSIENLQNTVLYTLNTPEISQRYFLAPPPLYNRPLFNLPCIAFTQADTGLIFPSSCVPILFCNAKQVTGPKLPSEGIRKKAWSARIIREPPYPN